MSTTIDNRVVSMTFDNKDFETNAQTSINTLAKLKESLNLSGAAQGMDEINSAAKDITALEGYGAAVETVGGKFNVLQELAIGALRKIGENLEGQAEKMIKAFTIDNVSEGWNKYEEKTKSIATMMAATRGDVGTIYEDEEDQMAYINEQMEKLNWYTDETSYNLLDMTSNIGKFISNGVEVDDAVSAMMGITNWAGISGASIQEASRAMYNLSQAMGMGKVTLMDWKSIENANMATKEFKETCIETALALGTIQEVGEGVYRSIEGGPEFTVESFRESLTKGKWLDNDVLTTSLKKYSQFTEELYDLKNAATTLEGDQWWDTVGEMYDALEQYEKGNLNLQEISDNTGLSIDDLKQRFDSLTSAENELGRTALQKAQEAKTLKEAIASVGDAASTKWMSIFEAIFGDYLRSKKLWTDLAESLWDIFVSPIDTAAQAVKMWANLGGRDLLFGAEGVQGALSLVSEALGKINSVLFGWVPELKASQIAEFLYGLTEAFYNAAQKFHDFIDKLIPDEDEEKKMLSPFSGVLRFFHSIIGLGSSILSVVGGVISGIVGVFGSIAEYLVTNEKSLEIFRAIGNTFSWIARVIERLPGRLKSFFDKLKESEGVKALLQLVNDIKTAIGGVATFIADKLLGGISKVKNVFMDIFYNGDALLSKMVKPISNTISQIVAWLRAAKDSITTISHMVKITWQNFQQSETYQRFAEAFANIKTSVENIKKSISGWFTNKLKALSNLTFENFNISGIVGKVGKAIMGLIVWLRHAGELITDFATKAHDMWESFKESETYQKVADIFKQIRDFVTETYNKISGWVTDKIEKLSTLKFSNFDILGTVLNGILTVLGAIGIAAFAAISVVAGLVSNVVDLWNQFKQTEAFQVLVDAFEAIKNFAIDIYNTVSGWVSAGIDKVIEFFQTDFTKINIADIVQNVNDKFMEFVGWVTSAKDEFDKFVEKVKNSKLGQGISKFIDDVKKVGLVEAFKNAAEGIGDAILNFSLDDIDFTAFATNVDSAFKTIVTWFTNAHGSFDDFVKAVKESKLGQKINAEFEQIKQEGPIKVFTNFLDDVKKKLEEAKKAFENTSIAQAIKTEIQKIVGVFNWLVAEFRKTKIGSLVLGKIDEIKDKLKNAKSLSDYLKTAISTIGGFFKTIKEFFFGNGLDQKNLFERAKGVTSSIAKGILEGLKSVDWSKYLDAAQQGSLIWFLFNLGLFLLNFARVLNGVVSIAKGLKEFGKKLKDSAKNINKILISFNNVLKAEAFNLDATAILKLAIAFGILTAAFYALAKLDERAYHQALFGVIMIAGVIALLIWIIKKIQEHFDKTELVGATIHDAGQQIGGALADFGKNLAKGIAVALKSLAGKLGMAALIIAVAAAVALIAAVIYKLQGIKLDEIKTAVEVVIGIAVGLGVAVGVLSKLATSFSLDQAALVLAFALAIGKIADVLLQIASYEGEIWTALGVIGLIALGLTIATVAISKLGALLPGANAWLVLGIAGGIWILAQTLIDLSKLEGDISSGVEVLVSLAFGLYGACLMFSKIVVMPEMAGLGKFALELAFALTLLTIPVKAFAKFDDWKKLGQGIIAVGLLGAGIWAFAQFAPAFEVSALSMIGLAAAIAILTIPVAVFSQMDFNGLMQGVGAVGLLALALGAVAAVTSELTDVGAGLALLAIAAGIAILGATAVGVGMYFDQAAKGLITIGVALLALCGIAAIAGIPLVTDGLIAIGIACAGVGVSALGIGVGAVLIVNALKQIEGGMELCELIVQQITGLVEGFGALADAAVSFFSDISNDFNEFKEGLQNGTLEPPDDADWGFYSDMREEAQNQLSYDNGYNDTVGYAQGVSAATHPWTPDQEDFAVYSDAVRSNVRSNFTEENGMADVAPYYAGITRGGDAQILDLETGNVIGYVREEAQSQLTEENGQADAAPYYQGISDAATNSAFTEEHTQRLSGRIKTYGTAAFEDAKPAVVKGAEALGKEVGTACGNAFPDLAEVTNTQFANMNQAVVDNTDPSVAYWQNYMAQVNGAFQTGSNDVENTSMGFTPLQWLMPNMNIDPAATELLNGFNGMSLGIDTAMADVTNTINGIDINGMVSQAYGGVSEELDSITADFTDFSTDIGDVLGGENNPINMLGSDWSAGFPDVQTMINGNLESLMGDFNGYIQQYEALGSGAAGTGYLNTFASGMEQVYPNIETQMGTYSDGLLSQFTDNVSDYGTTAQDSINAMTQTYQNNYTPLYNSAQGLANQAVLGADSAVSGWQTSAANAAAGYINTLSYYYQDFYNTGAEAADYAHQGFDDYLGINSPSKLFGESGYYSVLGFANAVNDYSGMASNATTSMADEALNAVSNSIRNINEMMLSGIDPNPAIRPVMDLSGVENGLSAMNGMIDSSSTYEAAMNGLSMSGTTTFGQMLDLLSSSISRFNPESSRPIVINVTGGNNANADQIADRVMYRLNTELRRGKAAMA